MTTNQTTIGTASEQLRAAPDETGAARSRARQAVSTATSKAGATVRRNPKSATTGLLALAGAAVAAVFLSRRRAAAKSRGRRRLSTLLHR
ncbi:hypothetical protein [Actinoplanes aureus]|uniref:Uncharacterized protein n=1 Tax=Actinoplanes aureus TaxID=2792083 RepID=A0A931FVP1_9ACTN|nr:hypothetical protein [Actinoplanes aureus]MBG0560997.1 hypothetical protein [Actinoplanes aureus]